MKILLLLLFFCTKSWSIEQGVYWCVVTAEKGLLEIPVCDMDSQLMYDSCSDGMHNLVPGEGSDLEAGLDKSVNQWTRYLEENPFILNAGTRSVKK